MRYVLEILQKELRNEKVYLTNHKKEMENPMIKVSDYRVFQMSVRIAEKRIPLLQKAINKLSKKEPIN